MPSTLAELIYCRPQIDDLRAFFFQLAVLNLRIRICFTYMYDGETIETALATSGNTFSS